jgi:hypothetical protein
MVEVALNPTKQIAALIPPKQRECSPQAAF